MGKMIVCGVIATNFCINNSRYTKEQNQTCAAGALSSINGAARLMKEASPTPTNLKTEQCISIRSFKIDLSFIAQE